MFINNLKLKNAYIVFLLKKNMFFLFKNIISKVKIWIDFYKRYCCIKDYETFGIIC